MEVISEGYDTIEAFTNSVLEVLEEVVGGRRTRYGTSQYVVTL